MSRKQRDCGDWRMSRAACRTGLGPVPLSHCGGFQGVSFVAEWRVRRDKGQESCHVASAVTRSCPRSRRERPPDGSDENAAELACCGGSQLIKGLRIRKVSKSRNFRNLENSGPMRLCRYVIFKRSSDCRCSTNRKQRQISEQRKNSGRGVPGEGAPRLVCGVRGWLT